MRKWGDLKCLPAQILYLSYGGGPWGYKNGNFSNKEAKYTDILNGVLNRSTLVRQCTKHVFLV